ncbi:MAG: germination protein YpeB [Clostridia bacterium]|nr:germination protein YpeB [Clostridia bacterium]
MNKTLKIFLVISLVVLLAAATGLIVALVYASADRDEAQTRLNGVYEKSYFDAVDYLGDVGTKLDKVSVLSGPSLQSVLLADVRRESELAASDLSRLGAETENMEKVLKFLNQLSDYAGYLSGKLNKETLTKEEKTDLARYAGLVKDLEQDLRALQEKLVRGDSIDGSALSDFSLIDDLIKTYSSVDYPEMIYDGPFSDGLDERTAKSLESLSPVGRDGAKDLVTEYFPEATEIEYVGESSATIQAYLFSFRLGRNEGTLALTQKGGKVLSYNAYCVIDDPTLTEEECVEKGDEYIKKLGFSDMKAVWVNNNNSTVYINYAYVYDDIIVYPDLIKIKICSETGDLIGVESQNYLYNHVPRDLSFDKSVVLDLDESLTVVSQSYCVVPTDGEREIAAKEVVARKGSDLYYIYYDLSTEREIRCLVVIEDEGRLLR